MSNEFRFVVDPSEGPEARDARWDKELAELHSHGLTVQGVGPDGDYPIRYAFDEDGSMSFDEWWQGDPQTPWFEVYNLVPLSANLGAEVSTHTYDAHIPGSVDKPHEIFGGLGAATSVKPIVDEDAARLELGVALRDSMFGEPVGDRVHKAMCARAAQLESKVTL